MKLKHPEDTVLLFVVWLAFVAAAAAAMDAFKFLYPQ
jgi:hypothetical protein